jgi:hypothetical protein
MIYQIHNQHGYHMAFNKAEAESNEKRGWRTVSEAEFYNRGKAEIKELVDDLEERYEKKHGKRPHHRMKRESIEAALKDG